MSHSSGFILRSQERGYTRVESQMLPSGADAHAVPVHSTYLAGHPDTFLIRHSSFNFHEYQKGRDGLGKIRCFGEEIFSPNGCGYNMHPHHNFIIMAFILKGTLTHINTVAGGTTDILKAGDYYSFSTGSGGKHSELNLDTENELHVIYLWVLPAELDTTPTYDRGHFDPLAHKNKILTIVGNHAEGAIPIEQDFKVSRLSSDRDEHYIYKPSSEFHGVYFFVIEGAIEIENNVLTKSDSMAKYGVSEISIGVKANQTDLLIVETVL